MAGKQVIMLIVAVVVVGLAAFLVWRQIAGPSGPANAMVEQPNIDRVKS